MLMCYPYKEGVRGAVALSEIPQHTTKLFPPVDFYFEYTSACMYGTVQTAVSATGVPTCEKITSCANAWKKTGNIYSCVACADG